MSEHDDRKQRITDIFGSVMEREKATELTDLLLPVAWEELARRSDVAALGTELRAEMSSLKAELRAEMSSLKAELRGEMSNLKAELCGEMSGLKGELRSEMADVRKEVGDLRLEVHDGFARVQGQLPKLVAANLVSMVGVAGLVLAAGAM